MPADRPETVDDRTGRRPAPPVGSSDDHDDLRVGLHALSGLAVGRLSLEDTLTAVATFAVQAVPRADGAMLTLLDEERPRTVVATSELVAEVDRVQQEFGSGPCLSALSERQVVRSGSLGSEERWRRFGSRVARSGVHSALSLPLQTAEGLVGALTLYARAKHAFDDRAARLGGLFAVPAAIAVQNSRALARASRLVEQLERALEERGGVERAIGIIMSRSGCTPEEALDRLRQLSQDEHVRLAAVADSVVEEAVRRARARRTT